MLVSIVIPTVDGREGSLARAFAGFAREPQDQEVIVLRNRPTCGEAWIEGARRASGDYLCFFADDLVPHPGFLRAMIAVVDRGACPAPVVLEPDGTVQSAGIRGWDCHRPDTMTDWMATEHTTIPFMDRGQWEMLEPHAEMMAELHYVSDMFHSTIMAENGIPVVARTKARLTHYNAMPGRGAGMGQHERAAKDRATYERWLQTRKATDERN